MSWGNGCTVTAFSTFHLQYLLPYPDQCQGFAGTLQVSWPVSGICRYSAGILTSVRDLQVLCRYLDQCQEFAGTLWVSWPVSGVCRYSACIWPLSGFAEISLLSILLYRSQVSTSGDFLVAPACPVEKMHGCPLFYRYLKPMRVSRKNIVCARTGIQNRDPGSIMLATTYARRLWHLLCVESSFTKSSCVSWISPGFRRWTSAVLWEIFHQR